MAETAKGQSISHDFEIKNISDINIRDGDPMKDVSPNVDNPERPLSSSDLFVRLAAADTLSEYGDLFDRYWKKREEERFLPPFGGTTQPMRRGGAQQRAQGPQKSRWRKREAQGREDRRREDGGTP